MPRWMTAGGGGTGGKSWDLVCTLHCTGWHETILTLPLIGLSLEKNLLKAVAMSSKQRQVADDFTAMFPRETIEAWSLMVKEWEADPSKPNPYVLTEKGGFSV